MGNHPLAGGYLKQLREKSSCLETFRTQAKRLGHLLVTEATKDLQTAPQKCETPLCETTEDVISESIAIVPILRAGIGLVDPFLELIPSAHVWYLGAYRNETTHEPVAYYNKLPTDNPPDVAYVIDPMLATGGSALWAIEQIKNWGVKKIKFVGLIGAPEGVSALHERHPEIDIHLAALDAHLNENAYIVPGLGDAGDRIFNSF